MIPIKDNIPTDRLPLVTLALILVNAIAYVLAVGHSGSLISGPDTQELVRYATIPYALTHPGEHCGVVQTLVRAELACTHRPGVISALPAWETIFTSMFIHASIVQLAGNMLFLWIFGNTVEACMGSVMYLGLYLVGGLAALALEVALGPNSLASTVGASGAVAAVLGGYIVLYPRARVLTLVFIILFFTVIELPALLMLGVWFAEQAVFAATGLTTPTGGGGGVAFIAQVGSFGLGALVIRRLATDHRQLV